VATILITCVKINLPQKGQFHALYKAKTIVYRQYNAYGDQARRGQRLID